MPVRGPLLLFIMNRKKGDKGTTHQVICINSINFQRKSVVVKLFFLML
uniref:TATA-box binding protein associated factor 2 n=1 Tax=Naja naja TaxID=35670 RepID=A0A8C6YAG2_NAJNA